MSQSSPKASLISETSSRQATSILPARTRNAKTHELQTRGLPSARNSNLTSKSVICFQPDAQLYPSSVAVQADKQQPLKDYKYFSVIRVTENSSPYFQLEDGERAALIPIRIASGTPQVSWKPLIPGYITYVSYDFQVSAALDFVLVTT